MIFKKIPLLPGLMKATLSFTNFFHRCFLILDDDRKISLDNSFFLEQFEKDIAINVFKNGEWGCYIRQSVEPESPLSQVEVFHAFVRLNNLNKKSTLKWVTGPVQLSYVHFFVFNITSEMIFSNS